MTTIWTTSKIFWPFRQCGGNGTTLSLVWLLSGKRFRLQFFQQPYLWLANRYFSSQPDVCGKESFHFSLLGYLSCFEELKKSIYESLKIFSFRTKFSWKSFHQSQKWPKRYFCWTTKLPSLMFFIEVRASVLRFNGFTRIYLRCSFFGKRNGKDFLWKKNTLLPKTILKTCQLWLMLV